MRAALDELDALERGQLLAALGVVLLDVPGVPVARLVDGIDPELVAGAGQRLAAGRLVDEAGDRAVGADRRLQNGVLETRLAGRRGRRPARRRGAMTATPSGGTRAAARQVLPSDGEASAARRQRRIDDELARRRCALGQLRRRCASSASACAALPAVDRPRRARARRPHRPRGSRSPAGCRGTRS